MSPVRNAYIAINLGNMVNTANYTNNPAYIQLLPITNATQAAQDIANIPIAPGTKVHLPPSPTRRSHG
ncbi:hypothetical protein JVT61DRAFT_1068 [Boletus reticuloceps]|uniref:Uncharacterized protein n=1 Tax=Boletus reticuloceps TaxID=495285 RepID=A0A8I2YSI9_9AGAM|nr:hypothetical protein JVT61DRAFT_1068 [Boletus reticuloceps]